MDEMKIKLDVLGASMEKLGWKLCWCIGLRLP